MLNVPTGFARLLASENIGVRVDEKAQTAYFDTANRILTMPNWDCSERLTDMLIGHECAHAIFTNDGGDILSAIHRVGEDEAVAKDFLNVIEDARIDRLIQRRYPGLRIDYKAGLREMWERDFFGLKGRDINDLGLMDRINCHFKGSPVPVMFTPEEQVFVDRAAKTETFEEVIELARDLYEFEATRPQTRQTPTNAGQGGEGDGVPSGNTKGDKGDQDGSSTANGGSPSRDSNDSQDDANGGKSKDGKGEGTAESAKDADDDGSTADSTRGDSSQSGEQSESRDDADSPSSSNGVSKRGTPKGSETLRNAENEISKNTKQSNRWGSSTNYCLPKSINIDKIVIPFKSILDQIENNYENADYTEFKSGAKMTVMNLAQMFERKKAAAVAQRSQVAKTGRLDMTALHKYKMTEDIFLRNRVVIKGKNHGMIVFVDWSGSMVDCIAETIQQTVVLAMFCKKIGIPFRVYAFSTYMPSDWMDSSGYGLKSDLHLSESGSRGRSQEDFHVNPFTLLELFTNNMNAKQFDAMASALIAMGKGGMYGGTPRVLQLGGTPLNESILAAMHLSKRFREESKVDVMNSIWITDGADMSPIYGNTGLIQDNTTGEVWSYDTTDPKSPQGTDVLFRIYKDKIGGNLIGIYLDTKKSVDRRLQNFGNNHYGEVNPDPKQFNVAKMREQFSRDSFVLYPHKGYDTYFLMDKKVAVYTSTDALEALPDNATNTRIINAFKKDLGKRAISRPLLNAFTDRIAREIV